MFQYGNDHKFKIVKNWLKNQSMLILSHSTHFNSIENMFVAKLEITNLNELVIAIQKA